MIFDFDFDDQYIVTLIKADKIIKVFFELVFCFAH